MSQISAQKERQQLAAAVGGNSQGRQQLAATARETVEACDTSVGVFPRDREAQEAGSRHALGTGNRQWRPEVPGQTGVAGSSRQQGQYIIADLPTYEPAFGLVSHFA